MEFIEDEVELRAEFEKLEKALKWRKLKRMATGEEEFAQADEFMFMYRDDDGISWFKHSDTRNYIKLMPTGELVLPLSINPLSGLF